MKMKTLSGNLKLIFSIKPVVRLIQRYRDTLGIPFQGFSDVESYQIWKEKNNVNWYYSEDSGKKLQLYIDDLFKLLRPFNLNKINKIAKEALLFSEPDFKQAEIHLDSFYFDTLFLRSEKPLEEGLYIKISPLAKLTDIRKYISKNSKKLRKLQSFFIQKRDLRYFTHTDNFIDKRNFTIYAMSLLSPQQLIDVWSLNDKYEYKNQLIQRALKAESYRVSIENIKKICYRMKKIIET